MRWCAGTTAPARAARPAWFRAASSSRRRPARWPARWRTAGTSSPAPVCDKPGRAPSCAERTTDSSGNIRARTWSLRGPSRRRTRSGGACASFFRCWRASTRAAAACSGWPRFPRAARTHPSPSDAARYTRASTYGVPARRRSSNCGRVRCAARRSDRAASRARNTSALSEFSSALYRPGWACQRSCHFSSI